MIDIKLAPDLDSYPPLPSREEDGRPVIRRERCVCGDELVQYAGEDVTAAVRRHNSGTDHMIWRAER